ncbi:hypothetical protein EZS27_035592, partial [termite gut metagenome]
LVLAVVTTYKNPILTFYGLLIYCFALAAINRYLVKDAFPVGILCDAVIVYFYVLLVIKGVTGKVEWKRFGDAPFIILGFWLLYCILSLYTPDAPGFVAWFTAARKHLYLILVVPLLCIMLDAKTIKVVLIIWGVSSMILTAKSVMQQYVGLDGTEQYLINTVMADTHMLFGKLRAFSLLSDANTFGIQQAHAAVVGSILFLHTKSFKWRIFYIIMLVTGLCGMFLSGTRGAIFVILGGAIAYCGLVKNVKLILIGALVGGSIFYAMRYTYVGNNIYAVYRMRTAFRPEKDASYLLRMKNWAKLQKHLETRPFGGGLGSMEYGPKTSLLRKIPPDSGYILVWGDMGVVGLILFIAMYLYFLVKGALIVWFKIKNEWLRGILIAFISALAGDVITHYGNPALFMQPNIMIVIFSIAVIFAAPRIDRELMEKTSPN